MAVCRFCDIHCHNSESAYPAQYAKMRWSEFPRNGSMNLLPRYLYRSAWWKKTITQRVSQVLADTDLGPNVLEIGPGPGLTTDVLRIGVKRLADIEVDPRLAESL